MPIQWHSLVLSLFASLLSPFGGFFASGFKRAFKLKDFSDSIPGHGGVTDRMDCQFINGLFAYVYVSSFIRTRQFTATELFYIYQNQLPQSDQIEFISKLKTFL